MHEDAHIQERVALCDGCEALQLRLGLHLKGFTILLDFIHASEYLWKVANALLGETNPQRIAWMAEKTLLMLSGKTDQLKVTAHYFERNLSYMDYPTCLSKGWPIASGVIEGACRHFVKDRCELSGMRWTQTGAESLLRLWAIAENGDWDDYHTYRKAQRHIRLYGKSWSEPKTVPFQKTGWEVTHLEIAAICDLSDYEELPLAV